MTLMLAIAATFLALLFLPLPFFWIFCFWAAALFVLAAITRRGRALWINAACVFVPLAMFEGYLWWSQPEHADQGLASAMSGQLNKSHPTLGWTLVAGSVVRHTMTVDGEQIHDATYTIGSNGLRISSPLNNSRHSQQHCILLFGGSYAFGQGLQDNQTIPYYINVRSNNRYRPYNFGVRGYGPHHMLSALEHGVVDAALDCAPSKVSHVFYEAIPDHVRRAVGRIDSWSEHGPKYLRTEDGELQFQGLFADSGGEIDIRSLTQLFTDQLARSMVYRSIGIDDFLSDYGRNTNRFYIEIVEEARNIVRSKYPDAAFHVLLWDENGVDSKQIIEGLRAKRIALHLMSEILPGYQPGGANSVYRLHELDAHPSALANERIAEYVLSKILESRKPPFPAIPRTH